MNNELKIKLMIVAAVEANTAAEANERFADTREGKFNPPYAELYRDVAHAHRMRARTLLNYASKLAEFTPEEMAMMPEGNEVDPVSYTTILVVTSSDDIAHRDALKARRFFPGSAYQFVKPDAGIQEFRGFTLVGVILDNFDFNQLREDVQKSIRNSLLTVQLGLGLSDSAQLIVRSNP